MKLLETFHQEAPYYAKFFIIRFPRVDINSELNIIAADLGIKKQVEKPQKVSKAGKNAQLVETAGAAQTERLKMAKTAAGHIVIVEEHKHYNMAFSPFRKHKHYNMAFGAFSEKELKEHLMEHGVEEHKHYNMAFGAFSEEELKEHLMEHGVVDIQRVKLKRNGELLTTDKYILTFKKCERPSIINLSDWHSELVDEYRPKPQQCYNCLRYYMGMWRNYAEETTLRV